MFRKFFIHRLAPLVLGLSVLGVVAAGCSSDDKLTQKAQPAVVLENVAVSGGAFVEVGGEPGLITLDYRGQSITLPAFRWNTTTVVVVPPLLFGDSAELSRAGSHVRAIQIVAVEATGEAGAATLQYLDDLSSLLDELTPSSDPKQAGLHARAEETAKKSIENLRQHVQEAQSGGEVTIPLKSGEPLVFNNASLAALDAMIVASGAGVHPLYGPPSGSHTASTQQALTGTQATVGLALVGGVMICGAVAGAVGGAAAVAGFGVALVGGPVLGAFVDANSVDMSATVAISTSEEAGESQSYAQTIKDAAGDAWSSISSATQSISDSLADGSTTAQDASEVEVIVADYNAVLEPNSDAADDVKLTCPGVLASVTPITGWDPVMGDPPYPALFGGIPAPGKYILMNLKLYYQNLTGPCSLDEASTDPNWEFPMRHVITIPNIGDARWERNSPNGEDCYVDSRWQQPLTNDSNSVAYWISPDGASIYSFGGGSYCYSGPYYEVIYQFDRIDE